MTFQVQGHFETEHLGPKTWEPMRFRTKKGTTTRFATLEAAERMAKQIQQYQPALTVRVVPVQDS
jgi:hypothetical protein